MGEGKVSVATEAIKYAFDERDERFPNSFQIHRFVSARPFRQKLAVHHVTAKSLNPQMTVEMYSISRE